jgi:broad specificity phosphatase PhoE
MKLFFARHGESEANILEEFSNRGWKHGLTGKGRQQAHQLAQNLTAAGITKIYTSPLRRAVETAQILALALDAPLELNDALREFDCGELEGRSDPESWACHRQLIEAWLYQRQWEQRIPGGESFLDIQQRFLPFIERLSAEEGTADSIYVLVGHGGTYICMLPLALKNISFEFAAQHGLPNTAYVLAETSSQGFICKEWYGISVSSF